MANANRRDSFSQGAESGVKSVEDLVDDAGFKSFSVKFKDWEEFFNQRDRRSIYFAKELRQRYEVYKMLPVIAGKYKDVWRGLMKEKKAEVQIPEAALNKIDLWLEKEVTEKLNFDLLFKLQNQLNIYETNPVHIANLEAEIAGYENLSELSRQEAETRSSMEVAKQETEESVRREKGLDLVRSNQHEAGGIENHRLSLGSILEKEKTKELVKSFGFVIQRLKLNQTDLAAAEGALGYKTTKAKDLEKIEQAFSKVAKAEDLGKLEKDVSYLDAQQKRQAFEYVNAIKALNVKQKTPQMKGLMPALEKIVNYSEVKDVQYQEFKARAEAGSRQIEKKLEGLERIGLLIERVQSEPWNQGAASNLYDALRDYSFDGNGHPLLDGMMQKARSVLEKTRGLDSNQDAFFYREAVNYKPGNWLKRMFEDNPDQAAKKDSAKKRRGQASLEGQHNYLTGAILTVGQKTAAIERLRAKQKENLNNLFTEWPIAKELNESATKAVKDKMEALTNENVSYETFLEARDYFMRLHRHENGGEYQGDDGDDHPIKLLGENFLVKGYTADKLKNGIKLLMLEKARREIRKTFENISTNDFTIGAAMVRLNTLREQLGRFGKTEKYSKLERKAVEKLIMDSTLPPQKRVTLGFLLDKLEERDGVFSNASPSFAT